MKVSDNLAIQGKPLEICKLAAQAGWLPTKLSTEIVDNRKNLMLNKVIDELFVNW